jgi:hypothetical protein
MEIVIRRLVHALLPILSVMVCYYMSSFFIPFVRGVRETSGRIPTYLSIVGRYR